MDYTKLHGSFKPPSHKATFVAPTDESDQIRATIHVRRKEGHAPLPTFDHYIDCKYIPLSREEFAEKHGASQEDFDLIISHYQSEGFSIIDAHLSRRQIIIGGTVAQFNQSFTIELHNYEKQHPYQKRTVQFRSHDHLSIPSHLDQIIQHVTSLGNEPKLRTHYQVKSNQAASDAITIPTSTASFDIPPQLGSLYNFPTTAYTLGTVTASNGFVSSETFGLVALPGDGYLLTDVEGTFFYADTGSTQPPGAANYPNAFLGYPYLSTGNPSNDGPDVPSISIANISVDGTTNPGTVNGEYETLLDISMIYWTTTTPKVSVYFFGNNTDISTVFGRMVHPNVGDPVCNILSFSFGGSEDTTNSADYLTCDGIFEDAAALGITILASAGDYGSSNESSETDSSVHVNWPSSSPWVTAVGGTVIGNVTLGKAVTGNTARTEWVWNDYNTSTLTSTVATGGGISVIYPIPAFQTSVTMPIGINSGKSGRGVPDIAGNADPNSGIALFAVITDPNLDTYGDPQFLQLGGTSATTPLYAGLVGLINTKLGKNIGFLNSTLYKIGGSSNTVFRDIVTGTDSGGASSAKNNGGVNGITGYSVTTGWDACTGWGVINGGNLLSYLTSNPVAQQEYYIQIQATNSVGAGPMSAVFGPFVVQT